MVGRVSRYRTEDLDLLVAEVRAALRANPHGYDRRLLAGFLFVDRSGGEAVGLAVAGVREALDAAPWTPRAADGVVDYEAVEARACRPREGARLFGEFAAFAELPALDDRRRMAFRFKGAGGEAPLSVGVTEDACPYEMEYLFLHDAIVGAP